MHIDSTFLKDLFAQNKEKYFMYTGILRFRKIKIIPKAGIRACLAIVFRVKNFLIGVRNRHQNRQRYNKQPQQPTLYMHFSSFYQEQNGTGSISFQLSGTSEEIMKTATINRTGNTITISLPKSSYLLANKSFERFGEIIQKMDVTNSETTVTITFTCYNSADLSYYHS